MKNICLVHFSSLRDFTHFCSNFLTCSFCLSARTQP
ncbi:hypothetical protein DUNSADRAFT_9694 [Dunaliella salina]|uniref:Uncharacterized protein n=1 Tax=Dunaliella salina TaxID=3046 RepID=A0ABQ7GGX1_DUNSA|nr:hypothetical protein DUNSADRAFT_9694 [Dunaliella salina]|eukprot:KAF5833857.1 hypothetical protein DUNSADRAFT_9694 [Dunaliella salina]